MHKLKFNFLFSFNWKERHPPKTHLPALLSPPTHFTYFKDSLWIKTHTFKVSQLLNYFEKIIIKKLLNEGRLLNWENLKALLARAAAAVWGCYWEGNVLYGEELPPMSLPAWGDPAGWDNLQRKKLVFNMLSSQAGLSHVRAEGTCRTSGGFLPTQEKWGFAEVGKRWFWRRELWLGHKALPWRAPCWCTGRHCPHLCLPPEA